MWWPKALFQAGAIVVKLYFTNSKVREKHFMQKINRKTLHFKIQGGFVPLPLPISMHTG